MEKETIKETLEKIPLIQKGIEELKAFFSAPKAETPAPQADPAKPETPAEPAKEAKVEFNHEAFTKEFNDYKASNDEKFKSFEDKITAFEAQIKAANDTITKQDEALKKTYAIVEKILELPTQLSKQTKKEGVVRVSEVPTVVSGLEVWSQK